MTSGFGMSYRGADIPIRSKLVSASRVFQLVLLSIIYVKEHPSQGFMEHWFLPQMATEIDVLATYLHSLICRVLFSEEDRRRRSKNKF